MSRQRWHEVDKGEIPYIPIPGIDYLKTLEELLDSSRRLKLRFQFDVHSDIEHVNKLFRFKKWFFDNNDGIVCYEFTKSQFLQFYQVSDNLFSRVDDSESFLDGEAKVDDEYEDSLLFRCNHHTGDEPCPIRYRIIWKPSDKIVIERKLEYDGDKAMKCDHDFESFGKQSVCRFYTSIISTIMKEVFQRSDLPHLRILLIQQFVKCQEKEGYVCNEFRDLTDEYFEALFDNLLNSSLIYEHFTVIGVEPPSTNAICDESKAKIEDSDFIINNVDFTNMDARIFSSEMGSKLVQLFDIVYPDFLMHQYKSINGSSCGLMVASKPIVRHLLQQEFIIFELKEFGSGLFQFNLIFEHDKIVDSFIGMSAVSTSDDEDAIVSFFQLIDKMAASLQLDCWEHLRYILLNDDIVSYTGISSFFRSQSRSNIRYILTQFEDLDETIHNIKTKIMEKQSIFIPNIGNLEKDTVRLKKSVMLTNLAHKENMRIKQLMSFKRIILSKDIVVSRGKVKHIVELFSTQPRARIRKAENIPFAYLFDYFIPLASKLYSAHQCLLIKSLVSATILYDYYLMTGQLRVSVSINPHKCLIPMDNNKTLGGCVVSKLYAGLPCKHIILHYLINNLSLPDCLTLEKIADLNRKVQKKEVELLSFVELITHDKDYEFETGIVDSIIHY